MNTPKRVFFHLILKKTPFGGIGHYKFRNIQMGVPAQTSIYLHQCTGSHQSGKIELT